MDSCMSVTLAAQLTLACSFLSVRMIATETARVLGERPDNMTVTGYAQVYRSGAWYTVCNQGWTDVDAGVLCNELGYDRGVPFQLLTHVLSPVEHVWAREMACTRSSTSLDRCATRTVTTTCNPAGVTCDKRDTNLVDGSLRLSDGPTPYSGRVEVAYQGLWGAICDRGWDHTTASAVCGMLGHREGGLAVTHTVFGWPKQVFLDAVRCEDGSETSITECMNRDYMVQQCLSSRTASVVCYSEDVANLTGQVRLVNGEGDNEGYLVVNFYGIWGTICYPNWDDSASRVVCRQLGYETGQRTSRNFPNVYGPSWLRYVDCVGNETTLMDCDVPSWGFIPCLADNDIALECYDKDLSVQDPGSEVSMKNILLYTVPAGCALFAIILVSIIVHRRKAVQINNIFIDENKRQEKEVANNTKNPAYNTYIPSYFQRETSRAHSEIYNDITETDMEPTYLDLFDETGGIVRSSDDDRPLAPRVGEPLPQTPSPEGEYLQPEANIDNMDTYLTMTSLPQPEHPDKHVYENQPEGSPVAGHSYENGGDVDNVMSQAVYPNLTTQSDDKDSDGVASNDNTN